MNKDFINAIHSKSKIQLTFFSKEDQGVLIRLCAPMDYGPSRRTKNQDDRFHFWDYESDKKNHVLSLLPNQVVSMTVLEENFEPEEFISWETNWFVKRDWGVYS